MGNTWNWIKEKTAEAIVNAVVLGMIMLIGYGVLQAFIGDSKIEKATDALRKEMVDAHNSAVQREGELLSKLAKLQEQVDKIKKPDGLPSLPAAQEAPNPAQQQIDFTIRNQKRYKD